VLQLTSNKTKNENTLQHQPWKIANQLSPGQLHIATEFHNMVTGSAKQQTEAIHEYQELESKSGVGRKLKAVYWTMHKQ
jgi:hypothetical protein